MKSHHRPQSGIAIAPILFIIALLAILATAIAAGSGTFSSGSDQEKARINASAIIHYFSSIYYAVQRVRALGCSDAELSFENPSIGGYENPAAPSDRHCNIFDIAGGGIISAAPPSAALTQNADYFFSGATQVPNAGTSCGSASCNELEMTLGSIQDDVCRQINALTQNQDSIASQINPYDLAIGNSKYIGEFEYIPQNIVHLTGTFDARKPLCFKPAGSSANFFYGILMPR